LKQDYLFVDEMSATCVT